MSTNKVAGADGKVQGNEEAEIDKDDEWLGAPRNQRRRLKKLHKRAARFSPQTDLSGIFKPQEWEVVKEITSVMTLYPSPTGTDAEYREEDYAPWVGLRQTRRLKEQSDKNREGFDHRSTLKFLVHSSIACTNKQQGVTESRKRPRNEDKTTTATNLSIPSWICLHNPVCIEHIAVLEVHIAAGNKLKKGDVQAVAQSTLGANNAYPTKWFEGPRPQSISHVLLYEKPIQPSSNKKAKEIDLTKGEGQKQLIEELKSLVLSEEQLEKEGYPLSPTTSDPKQLDISTLSNNQFCKPTSFSLEQAKALVKSTHVNLPDHSFPFIKSCPSTATTTEGGPSTPPRIFGLDCEMVQTQNGTELGRVTLIEYNPTTNNADTSDNTTTTTSSSTSVQDSYDFQVLMDELVLPYPTITNYVTAYSGITAELLKDVDTRLEQIQASLLTYIRPHDIVVGHSLENDLRATRWIHPTVVDTAILFRNDTCGARGSFKYSLKHLSNVLLHKRIQDGTSHCSEEDASATLELAIRRAQKGPSFAVAHQDKQWWIPTTTTTTSSTTSNTTSASPAAPMVFIGPAQWLTDHVTKQPSGIHALTCDNMDHPNIKAVLSWLTGPKRRAGLVWGNLVLSTPQHLKSFEKLLVELKAKMSVNTIMMVNLQPGYAIAAETSQRRRTCKNNPKKCTLTWSDEDEKHCKDLVENCRYGSIFWVSKHPGPGGKQQ